MIEQYPGSTGSSAGVSEEPRVVHTLFQDSRVKMVALAWLAELYYEVLESPNLINELIKKDGEEDRDKVENLLHHLEEAGSLLQHLTNSLSTLCDGLNSSLDLHSAILDTFLPSEDKLFDLNLEPELLRELHHDLRSLLDNGNELN